MMNTRVTLAAGFILGLVVVAFVFWSQLEKRYIFFPSSVIEQTPAEVGVEYEEVFFTTETVSNCTGGSCRAPGMLPGSGSTATAVTSAIGLMSWPSSATGWE